MIRKMDVVTLTKEQTEVCKKLVALICDKIKIAYYPGLTMRILWSDMITNFPDLECVDLVIARRILFHVAKEFAIPETDWEICLYLTEDDPNFSLA